ncbi:MAG: type II toxin-antitoxin system VapB family antitoxin [Trueperaceae bacterium]|nr:type II toxin-antitoxin system VapB family antitoxin [Trueperaceae bacterium]
MSWHIEDPSTYELARALAERRSIPLTQAVHDALHEALLQDEEETRRTLDRLNEISRHCARLPVLDDSPVEELLDYDERGLPR